MDYCFDNNLPIYKQLVEKIKVGIITGVYASGDKLPSVRELSHLTKVNPNTIQRALSELEAEKLIFTKRTSGKFVTDDLERIQHVRQEKAQQLVDDFLDASRELHLTKKEIIQLIKEKGGDYESN